MAKTEFFPERFNVDTQGMRQLHENRHPEQLVKELIQNCFDEDITTCRVRIQPAGISWIKLVVEDDGPGFSNIRDSYTLMGDTRKRLDPTARGRFNMGEKEVLSIAESAVIETPGHTVTFPPQGGRTIVKNRRTRGTIITAMMPWDEEKAARLEEKLGLIRPPEDIDYRVNNRKILRQKEITTHSAILDTVIQDGPGEPMRPTRRRTHIHVLEPQGGTGRILEMGIPIQEIEAPYDVDVMQKVPMPPNRDTVGENYLKKIYTELLNAMHGEMPEDRFSENWVRAGVESNGVTEDAVRDVIHNRYGERVVTWSSQVDANMRATDAGYKVIHPRSLGQNELENMKAKGGLKSASDEFPRDDDEDHTRQVEENEVREGFANWVRAVGMMAQKRVTPIFIYNSHTKNVADCTMNTMNPVMRFNTHFLDDKFFEDRGSRQLELIIHELGHSDMTGEMSHGPRWGEACARVGALIADNMRG